MNRNPAVALELVRSEKRSRWNPLKDLTPDKLAGYLDEFRAGYLRNLAQVMELIEERDDTLSCVVPKAKASVARHDWEVLTVDTQDEAEAAQAQKQKEVLEHFYNNLQATSALDQDEVGGLSLLLRQMMDAKGKRYSIHNIVWQPEAGGRYTATFHHVPLWFFENTEGRMRFISQPYGWFGEEMDPEAWLVTRGRGVMIACAVAWMYKHIPLRDWLIYCGRHGMPGIEGVTDAPEGSEEWERAVAAVAAAAAEFAWVRSRSTEIKTIDFSAQGELPYPKLVERMDRAMSALWRGADLSTISSGQGAGRGASLQGEESDIIEEDDLAWLSETLNFKVDRLVLDYVFGPGTPALAYLKVLPENQQDVDQDIKVDQFLLKSGFPVGIQQISERYHRPLPDDDDEILKAPAPLQLMPPGEGDDDQGRRPAGLNDAAVGRFADALGVPERWLGPVATMLREVIAKAEDQSLSDADLLVFLDKAARRIPELFDRMDTAALADVMEASMGEAALEGLRQSLRKQLTPPAR